MSMTIKLVEGTKAGVMIGRSLNQDKVPVQMMMPGGSVEISKGTALGD